MFFYSKQKQPLEEKEATSTVRSVSYVIDQQQPDLPKGHSATVISSTPDQDVEIPINRRRSAVSLHSKEAAGSRSTSHSSLLRQVKMREVRMAFFTSDSNSSLTDGAGEAGKDKQDGSQHSLDYGKPPADDSARF